MGFGQGHHLHLIDGSAFIFRAYHALPPLTRKSDGLPVGAVNRVPVNNEIRANLHIGGRAKKTNLTKREKFICNKIKYKLREKGLFFTGIDVIDGYLTEINVTSPTCIREIDALNKVNISYIYWEEALQLRNHRTDIFST